MFEDQDSGECHDGSSDESGGVGREVCRISATVVGERLPGLGGAGYQKTSKENRGEDKDLSPTFSRERGD